MNIVDYITDLLTTLGFDSIEDAKKGLHLQDIESQAYEFYLSNNGAEGTVLWTEVLDFLNLNGVETPAH